MKNSKREREILDILHDQGYASVEELADRINEAALCVVGDVILEEIDGAYAIIEDYKNLFSPM